MRSILKFITKSQIFFIRLISQCFCFVHICPGLVIFFLLKEDQPTVVVGLGIVRIYFNGLVKISDGLGQFALLSVDISTVVIGLF
jgi:hypothetical protein